MTDFDLITEYIHNAMQAVDKAHKVTNELRENVTPETFDQFRAQMQELTEHLTRLQTVWITRKPLPLTKWQTGSARHSAANARITAARLAWKNRQWSTDK